LDSTEAVARARDNLRRAVPCLWWHLRFSARFSRLSVRRRHVEMLLHTARSPVFAAMLAIFVAINAATLLDHTLVEETS